ncbi:MAG: DUF5676 family membrane protein [Candidatus Daviesbacteria bacterium]|nr:DUF5676 family membrane protein [Candidatus Daviesbacteria bacterium]
MLNAKAFANAATAVMAVYYIVCALLSYSMPDLIFGIAKSWMHSISIESLKAASVPDIGSLFLGFVTLAGLTWLTTYGTIWLYNRWAR